MKLNRFACAFSLVLSVSVFANEAAEDALIAKMRQIHERISQEDSSYQAISLRLADLLAERARKNFVKTSGGVACDHCSSQDKDRVDALSLYESALAKASGDKKAALLSQIGHLYEMIGNKTKAQQSYQKILSSKVSNRVKSAANFNLGEMSFKQGDFAQAERFYQKNLQNQASARKGFVSYRLAWSLYRQGKTDQAVLVLKKMLTTPSLLVRGGSDVDAKEDLQFRDEIAKDLATFMLQTPFTQDQVDFLLKNSSKDSSLDILSYYAVELERLGKQKASLDVWRLLQAKQTKPEDRIQSSLYLSSLFQHEANAKSALDEYKKALSLWTRLSPCQLDRCDEWKLRLRNFPITWNKKNSSKSNFENLIIAYQSYLNVFPSDVEIHLYQAQLFKNFKHYSKAFKVYQKAWGSGAISSYKKLTEEEFLLQSVDLAEESNDSELRQKSYVFYLSNSKEQTKKWELRYQQAYIDYENKQYSKAVEGFNQIAVTLTAPVAMRNQSADLVLDAISLLKDDAALSKKSMEYSKLFSNRKAEFDVLLAKSLMNQSSKIYNGDAQDKEAQALLLLDQVDVDTLSHDEQIQYWKNRITIASSLKRYDVIRKSAESLLSLSKLDSKTKNFAQGQLANAAELQLDFQVAFDAYQRFEDEAFKGATRALKLALLSELANKPSSKYYKEYLKHEQNLDKQIYIVQKILNKNKNKTLKDFLPYVAILKKDKNNFSRMLLEYYAKNNDQQVKEWIKKYSLSDNPQSKLVLRDTFYPQYKKTEAEVSKLSIDDSNQKKLAFGIKKRISTLKNIENLLSKALKNQEWTQQMAFMSLLQQEHSRFYDELLSLPMPEGLTTEQQGEYLNLLSQKASPHNIRSEELIKTLNSIWGDGVEVSARLKSDIDHEENMEVRKLLFKELHFLSNLTKGPIKEKLLALTKVEAKPAQSIEVAERPNLKELENARKNVRLSPFDQSKLQELLRVEKSLRNEAMVDYLKARITSRNSTNEGVL